MSDYTKVNFVQMEQAELGLLQVVSAMDKATDELLVKLQQVLGEHWAGDAANFFEEHRRVWDAAEQEMGRQLGEAAKALGVANANYKAAEARNKAIWSNH